MSRAWSTSEEEEVVDENKEDYSLLLFYMIGTHFCFFLITYFWLYPTAEPPKNAIMHKLTSDPKKSRLTGEPVRPATRLSIREISFLSRRQMCQERKYQLTEEDQKTLMMARDGEVNYLREAVQMHTDKTMNYGCLIVERGVPIPTDTDLKQDIMEPIEDDDAAPIEDLARLKRHKEPEKPKTKRKKTKERMEALDQLTRGVSAEKLSLFKQNTTPDQSRKLQRTISSMLRPERTQDGAATIEDDKTQQRVIVKKPSSKPTQRPSTLEVNKKKSNTQQKSPTSFGFPKLKTRQTLWSLQWHGQ
ncbi:hypothetical protein CRE_26694 [Caenorhabditis remanei]|uniref:Uncharacterized protein n=1 Tax=Caenorhabditis remanei TaxID=31234 RepID=E3ML12_CAERE|nr:hypothetical protein CRE_26694 [Caenorhabditis remanei]